jgi:hypothetical protein
MAPAASLAAPACPAASVSVHPAALALAAAGQPEETADVCHQLLQGPLLLHL